VDPDLFNPDPEIKLNPDTIRIHNSTLEDKFFQRLKNQQKRSKDISSLYYFYTFQI
jgi:hypothetical protein